MVSPPSRPDTSFIYLEIKNGIMEEEDRSVQVIDCETCPYGFAMASPEFSRFCKDHIKHMHYDSLRLKTKLLTKEYNKKLELMSLEPFFVDVRFLPIKKGMELVEEYILKTGAEVRIFKSETDVGYTYHITIPEMFLRISDLKKLYQGVQSFETSGETKSDIIKRWYQEYGILEHLMFDDQLLEINVNPPAYKTPMRIVHSKYDECTSNICPSDDFLNYLATRLKINTGRPLNKAEPHLDGELRIEDERARVAAIIDPFSIYGTAYSIRKHRNKPWTLPLFMDKKSMNYLFAGLMSFAITHGRSFLIAGPRGSGKTAVLGSLILEVLPKFRMITIEDTQELPIDAYSDFGYDILPLKVRSALLKEGMEMPFDTGLRTSLRLGDSCLFIGEIRSKEATVLYEAMRVGAMANVVAGTIHADSPYGVYDRVVNDLGVPKGSFKVTDLIVIINQIKSPGGDKRLRRVMRVTEVLKDWEDKPQFQDLLVYSPTKDHLVPTPELMRGKSVLLNTLLKTIKGSLNYNDLLNDLLLRGWAKQIHLNMAKDKPDYLEAKYVVAANVMFSKLFSNLKPLESAKNMTAFKQAYTYALDEILGQ